ncbi:ABC transporter ATP-binding protein [Peptoniphilus sp. GNH]|nr:ABC transporter ATP-binding protein [Peptoniphilus sp. GNH]
MPFIQVRDLVKKFKAGEGYIVANDHISFDVEEGEFCIIVGPSGAGKSTLLNIIGGMDTADSGELIVDGKNIVGLSEKELTKYRREDVGFVFQFYNLIPNLTSLENVELASQIVKDAHDSEEILKELGLSDRMQNFPSQLSGGEQQRVSIARALAKRPKLLLCDEPTGALDYHTGKQVLKILQDTCKNTKMTVILITHNQAITPMADRVIEIKDAKLSLMKTNSKPKSVDTIEW